MKAAKVAPQQAALAYGVITERGCASPEEVVAILRARGHFVLLTSIRARICGLRRMGLVVDSGERGVGESKRCAVIKWRLATPAEREAWEHAKAAERDLDAQGGRG